MSENVNELLGVNRKEFARRKKYSEKVIIKLNEVYSGLNDWLGSKISPEDFYNFLLDIDSSNLPLALIKYYAGQKKLNLPDNVDILKSVKLGIIPIPYPESLIPVILSIKGFFNLDVEIAAIADCGCFNEDTGTFEMNDKLQEYLEGETEVIIDDPVQVYIIQQLEEIVQILNELNYATGESFNKWNWEKTSKIFGKAIETPGKNAEHEFRINPELFKSRTWLSMAQLVGSSGWNFNSPSSGSS